MKQTRKYQPDLLLRQARWQRGWSQPRLADLIGAPGAYMVNRWEQGSIFPTVGRSRKRASMLDAYMEYSLYEFLDGGTIVITLPLGTGKFTGLLWSLVM